MTKKLPPGREIKFQAKRSMTHLFCIRATLRLVIITLLFFFLRFRLGGTLNFALVSLANYGDTASGIYVLEEGINLIFRMDLTQSVLALTLTYRQIQAFLLINALFFLVLAPLRMGTMEQYWAITRGEVEKPTPFFQWFTQPASLLKAVVVEFCLQPLTLGLAMVASIPSFYLFYLFYKTTPTVASITTMSSLLEGAATMLAILAALLAFWVHSLLLPVRYCLASHPEYSLRDIFVRGFRSARGVRGDFFRFRLSFLLWFVISRMTYGAMDLFVTPYTSLSGMHFLQVAARVRQEEAPSLPGEGDSSREED